MDWNTGEVNAKYWITNLLATTVGTAEEKTIFNSTITITSSTPSPSTVLVGFTDDEVVVVENKTHTFTYMAGALAKGDDVIPAQPATFATAEALCISTKGCVGTVVVFGGRFFLARGVLLGFTAVAGLKPAFVNDQISINSRRNMKTPPSHLRAPHSNHGLYRPPSNPCHTPLKASPLTQLRANQLARFRKCTLNHQRREATSYEDRYMLGVCSRMMVAGFNC
jgi:hypothetical protein